MTYIKLFRGLKDKSFYSKDSEKLHLWIHLLLSANWTEREEYLGGKPIICKAGQFTTGRKQLAEQTGISESKIERILTYFEKIEQQIEQQKTNTNRLISILNWVEFQQIEQQIEQRVNNDRTTSEQRVNTLEEVKNNRIEERKNIFYNEIAKFVNYYKKEMLKDFFEYWTEKNKRGTKMKFEMQTTWELSKRLTTWKNNQTKFNKPPKQSDLPPIKKYYTPQHIMMLQEKKVKDAWETKTLQDYEDSLQGNDREIYFRDKSK